MPEVKKKQKKQKTKQNKKDNCSGPLACKSQRVGGQSNQKLLHHYQHSKYQLIKINS